MAEISLPLIVTAIANPELEGFISGTLFNQGWSVIYRALDAASLKYFFESENSEMKDLLLIFSPDLIGLTPAELVNYRTRCRQVVGFDAVPSAFPEYPGLLPIPKEAAELVQCVRGFVRAPLLRSGRPEKRQKKRAKVFAIASPAGATGCTSIAINLAMEFSAREKETLLIDADVRSPAIATLLGLHKLAREDFARPIADHLQVSEFTQSRVEALSEYLNFAVDNFDFVVIDLGSIEEFSDSQTDRRWSATMVHWSCENADEIIFVGRADLLSLHRFEVLVKSLIRTSIQAKVSFLLNMRQSGRGGAGKEASFFSKNSAFHPHRKIALPKDVPAMQKAEEERATLIEVSERSALRREIAKLAGSLAG